MGAFTSMPEGLEFINFAEALRVGLSAFDHYYILTAPHKRGEHTPVGLLAISITGYFPDGRKQLEPTFIWFPWSSPRNRIESAVHYFNRARQDDVVTVHTTLEGKDFMTYVCKYGIARRVGTREYFYARDEVACMFETRRV